MLRALAVVGLLGFTGLRVSGLGASGSRSA